MSTPTITTKQLFSVEIPKLLTAQQAAALLGIAVQTLAIWRCSKRYPLPYIKVGRAVRYRESDVNAFLASRTQHGSLDNIEEHTNG